MFGPQLSQWYILLEWDLCMMMVRIKAVMLLAVQNTSIVELKYTLNRNIA